MSSTLTGVPATITPAGTNTITAPDDGDALNAASVNVAFQKLIDFVAVARTGYTTDADPQIQTTTAPTNYKLLWRVAAGGGPFIRFYATATGFVWTYNCVVTTGGTPFAQDIAADSYMMIFATTGFSIAYRASAAAAWAIGGWVAGFGTTPTGALTSLGAITATAGGVTATAGDVTATAGNIVATAGDPASDGARVKGKQFVTATAAKPTAAAGPAAGAGPAAPTVTNGSTDIAGSLTLNTGTTAIAGVLGTVTLNKPYPAAPYVVITPLNAITAALEYYVGATTAAGGGGGQATFTIAVTATNLADTQSYVWGYHIIGTAT